MILSSNHITTVSVSSILNSILLEATNTRNEVSNVKNLSVILQTTISDNLSNSIADPKHSTKYGCEGVKKY